MMVGFEHLSCQCEEMWVPLKTFAEQPRRLAIFALFSVGLLLDKAWAVC